LFLALLFALVAAGSCQPAEERLTADEAKAVLVELETTTKVMALSSGVVEISTDFTIGGAVEDVVDALHDWFTSQMPCAEITVEGASVEVDFGELGDTCVHHGRTYAGVILLEITHVDSGIVTIQHTWTGLTNGDVHLTGTADVTWDFAALTRTIDHEADWQVGEDSWTGSGRRVMSFAEDGSGLTLDGDRSWSGTTGVWDLTIVEVAIRWMDPVPESGGYNLTTPAGKEVSVSFERQSSTIIQVTIAGPRASFSFPVVSLSSE
jgi:hypothetical protein